MPMTRLDKLLANLGYNSRKGAAIMVKQGRMSIDGEIIKNPAHKIDPDRQEVLIDDEPIDPPGLITIAMHKPEGVICDNDEGQHNVFQQIPFRWRLRKPGLSCAGRLDKDSRGLVILSEDGQLVHRITSPNFNTPKTYRVTGQNPLSDKDIADFTQGGIRLTNEEDKPLKPCEVTRISDTVIEMTLQEGRNRQIRRMFHAVGNDVTDLLRIKIGQLDLDALDLKENAFKHIQPNAIIRA